MIVFVLAYALSRSRYYTLASLMTVFLFSAFPIGIVLFQDKLLDFNNVSTCFSIGMILASIFYSRKGAFYLMGFYTGVTILFIVMLPEFTFVDTLFDTIPLFVLSGLLIIGMGHRDEIEKDRQAQLSDIANHLREEVEKQTQTDVALRKNRLRYRALFEHTHGAAFILNLEGEHVMVNQQAADMLGYLPEEMIGMKVEDVVAPYEYPDSQDVIAGLLAGKDFPVYERVFRHKDGSDIPVSIDVALVRDEDGQPLHIQSLVRDISNSKRTERLLKAINASALAMQEARTPKHIYALVGEALKELDIQTMVFLVDESQRGLFATYVSYKNALIAKVESLLGTGIEEISILVDSSSLLQQVIVEHKVIYLEELSRYIKDISPKYPGDFFAQAIDLFDISTVILAPIIVNEEILGLL
ncbi:MAG: PAS domain S-box protein, partial [Chloroflexota bacterium]|nr:PAS domain S-box protein [Chloroflexota bacterium]